MSLLRLLAVGRSLSGIAGPAHRYKLGSSECLPKFNSGRSAPLATFKEVSSEAMEPLLPMASVVPTQASIAPSQTPAASLAERELPAEAPLANPFGRSQSHKPSRKTFWGSLKEFFRPRRARRVTRPLVQGELSLDAVKVLRNDLSDSDSELFAPAAESGVVAAKGAAIEEKGVPASAPVGKSSTKWNELSAKLFASSQSRLR